MNQEKLMLMVDSPNRSRLPLPSRTDKTTKMRDHNRTNLESIKSIGAAIKSVRTARGMLQTELNGQVAELLGEEVHSNYICKIENGHSGISLDRLAAIADCLNCSVQKLFELAEHIATNRLQPSVVLSDELLNAVDRILTSTSTRHRKSIAR